MATVLSVGISDLATRIGQEVKLKEPLLPVGGTTAHYLRGDKTWATLNATAVGLGSVNNTADAAKNVSSATKLTTARTINGTSFDGTANITVADATKEPVIAAGTTAQYLRGDKSWQTLNAASVGLGSVNNTADTAKPVSTAQQTALDAKINTAGSALTLWSGTQAQYDALGTWPTTTVYVVT